MCVCVCVSLSVGSHLWIDLFKELSGSSSVLSVQRHIVTPIAAKLVLGKKKG